MALGARVDGGRRLDDDEVEVMSLRESDEDEGEGGEDGDEEKDGGGAGRASGAVAPGGARQGSSGVGKGSPLGAGRERKRAEEDPHAVSERRERPRRQPLAQPLVWHRHAPAAAVHA